MMSIQDLCLSKIKHRFAIYIWFFPRHSCACVGISCRLHMHAWGPRQWRSLNTFAADLHAFAQISRSFVPFYMNSIVLTHNFTVSLFIFTFNSTHSPFPAISNILLIFTHRSYSFTFLADSFIRFLIANDRSIFFKYIKYADIRQWIPTALT